MGKKEKSSFPTELAGSDKEWGGHEEIKNFAALMEPDRLRQIFEDVSMTNIDRRESAQLLKFITEEMFTDEMYEKYPPAALFKLLQDEKQAVQVNPVTIQVAKEFSLEKFKAENDKLTIFADVEVMRREIGENHYAIVALLMFLYLHLSNLYDEVPDRILLKHMSMLAGIALEYNSHSPGYALQLEQNALMGLGSVGFIVSEVQKFLREKEFNRALDAAQKERISSAVVNLASMSPRIHCADLSRESSKGKSAASSPAGPSVFILKIGDISVDLTAEPIGVLSSLQMQINKGVTDGINHITQMVTTAAEIKYDPLTGQFGVAPPMDDNHTQMVKVYKQIAKYFRPLARGGFEPMLTLETQHAITTFFLGVTEGRQISRDDVPPGATIEKFVRTEATTSKARREESSIFDSLSDETRDEFTDEIEEQKTHSHDRSWEVETSLERTNRSEIAQRMEENENVEKLADYNYSGGIHEDFGPKHELQLKYTKATDVTTGLDNTVEKGSTEGSNRRTNENISDALENMARASETHERRKNSKRDRSVSQGTEDTTTENREESERRAFTNPNPDSVLRVAYHLSQERHLEVFSVTGFRLVFSNGFNSYSYMLSEIPEFLDKALRPEFASVKDVVMEYVRSSCKVPDYRGRLFELWDESAGYPRIRTVSYAELLAENADRPGYDPSVEDQYYTNIYYNVPGVISKLRRVVMKGGGLAMTATPGKSALNERQARRVDLLLDKAQLQIDITRNEIAMGEAKAKEALARAKILEAAVTIASALAEKPDADISKFKDLALLTTREGREIVDNLFLGSLLSPLRDQFKEFLGKTADLTKR